MSDSPTPTGPITLKRDCEAVQIPFGAKVMLPAGSEVTIQQSLGGTWTVFTDEGQMVRIAGKDADAGKSTYPALVGIEASRAAAARHIEVARRSLERWPRSARLQELAAWVGTRLH